MEDDLQKAEHSLVKLPKNTAKGHKTIYGIKMETQSNNIQLNVLTIYDYYIHMYYI